MNYWVIDNEVFLFDALRDFRDIYFLLRIFYYSPHRFTTRDIIIFDDTRAIYDNTLHCRVSDWR